MKKKILVLGCTGSIGTSTLKIIESFSDRFEVTGLSAHTNPAGLIEAGRKFNCKNLCLSGSKTADSSIKYSGQDGLKQLIKECNADIAVNGIAGSAGLLPSVWVLENGIDLALANKETIVMAAPLVYKIAEVAGKQILPVDSEHSAVFSLINKYGRNSVSKIILTASGGPFRKFTKEQLNSVTVEDALKHPTWNMGKKITIDSATLANKGLEVIEACRLFDVTPDNVKVTVHPQSLVHSLIETKDGILYGQISKPDMRHPIMQALFWPDFTENNLEKLDLSSFLTSSPLEMTFAGANTELFPMLKLAYSAAEKNGGYTIAYNAANEIAVQAFADKKIGFYGISEITEKTLQHDWTHEPKSIDEVMQIDKEARLLAENVLQSITKKDV